MPVFLIICFLIHPWLGVASLAGAVTLFTMTLLTERASRAPATAVGAGRGPAPDHGRGATPQRRDHHGDGNVGALAQRWAAINDRYIAAVASLSDVVGAVRHRLEGAALLLQSVMLGLGAYP